ncbi:hypothetical protein IK146_02880 [Candidatus Saccharibacteria bacterium]|nr:hypothetical protein [Candidatus Saccharibacteria bacterium]
MLAIVLLACSDHTDNNEQKKKSVFTYFGVFFLICTFFGGLIIASWSKSGDLIPYTAYNLEKGDDTIELVTLPEDPDHPDNRFISLGNSLKGSKYYIYATKSWGGSKNVQYDEVDSLLIDKSDEETPHLGIYFSKGGFREWYYYIYAIPLKRSFYVAVVPESEPVEDTFNLE